MARALPYASAIQWIADNDDTEWLWDGKDYLSVSAALVCDLYGKTEQEVARDIRKILLKKEKQDRLLQL